MNINKGLVVNDLCFPIINQGNQFLGICFRWQDNKYLTCKHVINNTSEQFYVIPKLGTDFKVEPLRICSSPKYDLSVLYLEWANEVNLDRYTDQISLGTDLTLIGYTQSPYYKSVLDIRCIKSYIHRAQATPHYSQSQLGLYRINEINEQIPKGFSGGPTLTLDNKLIGMSVGTNISENTLYRYEHEKIKETNPVGQSVTTTIVEKNYVERYGLFHSISDIDFILSEFDGLDEISDE